MVYFILAIVALTIISQLLRSGLGKIVDKGVATVFNSGRKFHQEKEIVFKTTLSAEDSYKQVNEFITHDRANENMLGIRRMESRHQEWLYLDMRQFAYRIRFGNKWVKATLEQSKVDANGNIALGFENAIDLVPKAILKALKAVDSNAHRLDGANVDTYIETVDGWICECGRANARTLTYCIRCRRDKPALSPSDTQAKP